MKQNRIGWRRLLALLLAVCLLGGLTANVFAFDNVVASGTCGAEGDGSNLRWSMTADGVLTITGSGAMKDYFSMYDVPWNLTPYTDFFLKTVLLDDRITNIGSYAFYTARFGSKLTLPKSLVSIGQSAFRNCEFTGELILPDGLKEIDENAFDRSDLTGGLKLSKSLASIGDSAFQDALFDGELTFPSTLEYIGAYAFDNCYGLTGSLILPDGLKTLGEEAFDDNFDLSGTLRIPGTVKIIGDRAFENCYGLTKLILGDGIESIGSHAFDDCSSLTGTVQIPDSVAVIGDNAFYGTKNLTGVRLSSGLREIGAYAFSYSGISGVLNVPYGVEKIDSWAFNSCKNLTGLRLPASLRTIGSSAFSNCTNICGHLRLPDSLTEIGVYVFGNCKSLTGVTLSAGLEEIPESAFYDCSGLSGRVILGEKIRKIGGNAFRWCDNLREFCFLGDAPQYTYDMSLNSSRQAFPTDATLCYLADRNGWIGTKYNNVTNDTWCGYKLKTWDGRVTKPVDEDQLPEIPDTSGYENETTDRLTFRIYVPGSDPFDPPRGFRVEIDGVSYMSSQTASHIDEEICARKPKGYTGGIVISREGYHTYEMPAQQASLYTPVIMTPDKVTAPFAQTLLSPGSNLIYYGGGLIVYQTAPGADKQEPVRLFAQINWNGHGAGDVWLQQGETKLALRNGEWTSCALAETLVPGETVYLCARAADGAAVRTRTTVKVYAPVTASFQVNPGSVTVPTNGEQEELGLFEKMNLELDLSQAFQDTAIKFTIGRDGTFKGVLGVTLAQGSDVEEAYGKMKEAFAQLKNADNTEVNGQIANYFKRLREQEGYNAVARSSQVGIKGSIQVMGVFSGKFNDGVAGFTEIDAALVGSGSLSYKHQTFIALPFGAIPAYFKVALASKLQLMLKMVYDKELKQLEPQRIPLTFSTSLTIEAGPGWEGYFSGAAKGTGTLKFYGYVPIVKEDITATLAASFSFIGTLAGISGEWNICSTKEMAFWENRDFTWHEYTPGDDSLIGHSFKPDAVLRTMRFTAGQQNGGTLAQGISGYSVPCLTTLADGRLLAVWAADVPGRKLSDRGGIYYSVQNGDEWSAPRLVQANGKHGFSPVLQTVNGETWLLWQSYTQVWNKDTLTQDDYSMFAESTDVAAARFDSDGGVFTDASILNCAGYDYAPQLSLQNGAITAAWMNGGDVWTSACTNGAWAEPVQGTASWYETERKLPASWDAQTEAPAASARQCFSTDSYDAIVYTAEDENGVNQIYALWNDGYGWGEPFALTAVQSGSIGGFSAVIDEDEQIHILANVLTLGENGEYQSADLMLFEKALGADLTVSGADYVRRTLVPGKTVTLTAEVTNNGTKTVAGVHVSALDGSQLLTEADFGITLLPGQTKTAYLNYDLPESSALTGVTLRVVPQEGADADESDNTAQCAFQLVDLSVENVTSVVYGESTLLQAQIVNRGQKTSETTSVVFHLGTPEGEVLGTADLGAIEAGGLEQAELTLNRTLDDREMIYVEVPVQTDENLYGNNTNYGVVIVMPQQAQTSSVSESYADGTLTLQISLESVTTDVRAVAAAYDAEGRLLQTAALTGSGGSLTMELRTGVKPASWKLFLLDAETNQPICACVEG